MRTIMTSYVLLLLCASGCAFLDDLDRSIEQKAEQLTKSVAEPATPPPAPPSSPTPPARVPEPPVAPAEPAPTPEPPASPRGAPRVTVSKLDVHGALPSNDVRKIIERHKNELRLCYEQTLAGDALIVIKFVVSPTGAVPTASVGSSDSGIEKLDMCLAHAVRRWSFPAPKGGGIAVVTAAFELSRRS
jgi:hypothetical protein